MSTAAEAAAVLPELTDEQVQKVAALLALVPSDVKTGAE